MEIYVLAALIIVPSLFFGLRRGRIARRAFLAMVADLESHGFKVQGSEAERLLSKWVLRPKSVLTESDTDEARQIKNAHLTALEEKVRTWCRAGHIWMVGAPVGVVVWLVLR